MSKPGDKYIDNEEEKKSNKAERLKELRLLCASKRGELQLKRSSKVCRESVFSKTLKDIGIDKDKLKKDLEEIKKQGGLEIKLN